MYFSPAKPCNIVKDWKRPNATVMFLACSVKDSQVQNKCYMQSPELMLTESSKSWGAHAHLREKKKRKSTCCDQLCFRISSSYDHRIVLWCSQSQYTHTHSNTDCQYGKPSSWIQTESQWVWTCRFITSWETNPLNNKSTVKYASC